MVSAGKKSGRGLRFEGLLRTELKVEGNNVWKPVEECKAQALLANHAFSVGRCSRFELSSRELYRTKSLNMHS